MFVWRQLRNRRLCRGPSCIGALDQSVELIEIQIWGHRTLLLRDAGTKFRPSASSGRIAPAIPLFEGDHIEVIQIICQKRRLQHRMWVKSRRFLTSASCLRSAQRERHLAVTPWQWRSREKNSSAAATLGLSKTWGLFHPGAVVGSILQRPPLPFPHIRFAPDDERLVEVVIPPECVMNGRGAIS